MKLLGLLLSIALSQVAVLSPVPVIPDCPAPPVPERCR